MKLFHLLLPLLAALPLVTSALPTFPRKQPQQQQKPVLSPANSFNSDSSSSSSKSSKLTALKSLLSPSSEFKCHRYPSSTLASLNPISEYITTLMRSYRESIFHNDRSMLFETCYAGYEAQDVSPSIYFGGLGKRTAGKVERLLRNQVVRRFPRVRVVTSRDAVAVVVEEGGEGLRRRNTI